MASQGRKRPNRAEQRAARAAAANADVGYQQALQELRLGDDLVKLLTEEAATFLTAKGKKLEIGLAADPEAATEGLDELLNLRDGGAIDEEEYAYRLVPAIAEYPTAVDLWAHLANFCLNDKHYHNAVHCAARGVELGIMQMREHGYPGKRMIVQWGDLYNRPFLRACHALLFGLAGLGRGDQARLWREFMLKVNPSDNQGVRFLDPDNFDTPGPLDGLDDDAYKEELARTVPEHAALVDAAVKAVAATEHDPSDAAIERMLENARKVAAVVGLEREVFVHRPALGDAIWLAVRYDKTRFVLLFTWVQMKSRDKPEEIRRMYEFVSALLSMRDGYVSKEDESVFWGYESGRVLVSEEMFAV